MTFEVGIHLGNAHEEASAEAVVELGRAAEREGFAAVWMSEHIVVAADIAPRYRTTVHPFGALAYLAATTERVKLGTSVVVAPLHDPFLLAKLAAEIQALSGGRMRLGLGAGWYLPEFGYLQRPTDRRGARLDEAIDLLGAIWAGERSFEGSFWQAPEMYVGPLPPTPPEIWVGGNSEHGAARAERLGVTWQPIDLSAAEIADHRRRRPSLRIVPRVSDEEDIEALARKVAAAKEAGADGVAAGLQIGPPRLLEAIGDLAEALVP